MNLMDTFRFNKWLVVVLLFCIANLVFSGSPCGNPPTVDKSTITSQDDTTVKYKCDIGYEVHGRTTATCDTSTNTWTFADGRLLVCRPVSCGKPLDKANAHFNERSYVFGDDVNYICDTGYKQTAGVKDYNNIQCQTNGKWTVISFECGPVTCPDLSDPANGRVEILSGATGKYDYNHKYRFTCNNGYKSKSRETVDVTCLASGKWSEENIECKEINCPEPKTPENGIKLYEDSEGNLYGALREFRCFDNATMVGNSKNVLVTICQRNNEWSKPPPTCRLKKPNAVDEIHIIVSEITKTTAKVTWNEVTGEFTDYFIRVTGDGSPTATPDTILKGGNLVSNLDGLQSGKTYTVIIVTRIGSGAGAVSSDEARKTFTTKLWCGEQKVPDNAKILKSDSTSYTIVCNEGYRFKTGIAEFKFICQSNGWSTGNPECVEAKCTDGKPIEPPNGKIDKTDKDVYTFTCKEGYRPTGGQTSISITCVGGNWSPTTTRCEKAADSGGLSVEAWIGISIAIIAGVIIVIIAIIYIHREGGISAIKEKRKLERIRKEDAKKEKERVGLTAIPKNASVA